MSISSFVESVEYIETSIGTTSTGTNYNLTKGQDYNNCIPFLTTRTDDVYMDNRMVDLYFSGTTESGMVSFGRYNSRSKETFIKCYIVEFNPDQIRVQHGTFDTTAATTDEVTLSTTLSGTDRAAMTFAWKVDHTDGRGQRTFVRGRVLTTSGIDFYRYNNIDNCSGHWFLFEDLYDNFRVTHGDGSFVSVASQVLIHGEEQIDQFRSFLLGSFTPTDLDTSDVDHWSAKIFPHTDGSIKCAKGSGTGSIYWSYQLFRFLDISKIYTPFDHFFDAKSTDNFYEREVGNNPNRVPFFCNLETSSVVCSSMCGITRVDTISSPGRNGLFSTVELTSSGTLTYDGFSIYEKNFPYTVAVDWAGIDVDTGTNSSPIPVGSGIGESFVKSVESFRFEPTDTFVARTLSKGQTLQNCAVFSSSYSPPDGGWIRDCTANVYLLSPGVVCARTETTYGVIVDVSVVEFWPSQIKVQQKRDHLDITDSIVNCVIDNVSNVNKCFLTSSTSHDLSVGYNYDLVRCSLVTTSGVDLYKYNTTVSRADVSYFVVEDLSNNFITEHDTSEFAGNSYLYDTDTHFKASASFVLTSYTGSAGDNDPYRNFVAARYMHEYAPVYINRTTNSFNIFCTNTIVKFLDGLVHVDHHFVEIPTASGTVGGTYSNKLNNIDATMCFNVIQNSTVNTSAPSTTYIEEAFGSVRLTDVGYSRSYEINRTQAPNYAARMGFEVVDWIGNDRQSEENISKYIPTNNLLISLHKVYEYSSSNYIEINVDKQNIKQCVPFIMNTSSSANYPSLCYKAVYRYEDPDYFVIRFQKESAGDRDIMCYILEFNEDINIQHGSFSTDATSKSVDIDSVNLDHSFLVFYSFSEYDLGWAVRDKAVCGHFTSSSGIQFDRYDALDKLSLSWYVIESPSNDPYWSVEHHYDGTVRAGTSIEDYIDYGADNSNFMLLTSWSTNSANSDPDDDMFCTKLFPPFTVEFRRYAGAGSITATNIEYIEMSDRVSFRNCVREYYDVGATIDVDLQVREGFDADRSVVLAGCQLNESAVATSIPNAFRRCYHYYEFKDDKTVTVNSPNETSYNTGGAVFVYEWPEFNRYYVEGYVKEESTPVQREVHLYRTSTGEMVDSVVSASGTGYFFLETPYYDRYHVVGFDDDVGQTYNALIYSDIYPTIISGTFAYNQGWSTVSGIDVPIGIPLGRL